jgi:hypothetical protein
MVNCIFWNNQKGGNYSDIEYYYANDSLNLLNNIYRQGCPTFGASLCTGTIISDPLLNALADNGGKVFTSSISEGSSAIDAGVFVYRDIDGTLCYNSDGSSSYKKVGDNTAYTPTGVILRLNATDARGIVRPQGAKIDIGAFEKQ